VSETCRELTGNKVLWRDICWLFLDKLKRISSYTVFNSDFVYLLAESDYNEENKRGGNMWGALET
jgi:hypothetical protein